MSASEFSGVCMYIPMIQALSCLYGNIRRLDLSDDFIKFIFFIAFKRRTALLVQEEHANIKGLVNKQLRYCLFSILNRL